MPELDWKSPLTGTLVPGRHGAGDGDAGVSITEVRRALLSIAPRRDAREALGRTMIERFGLDLPAPGRFSGRDGLLLAASGHAQWMLAGPAGERGPEFAALREALREVAALVDHSDGRALLRVAGPCARRTLARLCPVDLHPRAFGPGRCAATRMGHVGALLLQLDALPTFEIHVLRSLAASFYHDLAGAAAEFGYTAQSA